MGSNHQEIAPMLIILLYLTFVFFFVTRHRRAGPRPPRNTPNGRRTASRDDEDESAGHFTHREYEESVISGAHHGAYDGPSISFDNW